VPRVAYTCRPRSLLLDHPPGRWNEHETVRSIRSRRLRSRLTSSRPVDFRRRRLSNYGRVSHGRDNATALNIFQNTEPSGTQRLGEAPAELALLRLRRSVALPSNELIGLIMMHTCLDRWGQRYQPQPE
jgi:hypothetical protein